MSDAAKALMISWAMGVALTACGLTVTKDRPAFKDLSAEQKDAVEVVVEELSGLNKEIEHRSEFSIATIVDKNKVNVSFEGVILSANVGDDLVHVAPWSNLDQRQRQALQGWFQAPSLETAKQTYERFFYRFLSTSQGTKQFMYTSLSTEWVFGNRSVYTVERDSIRAALSYYDAVEGRSSMWAFLKSTCQSVRADLGPSYDATFSKQYFMSNIRDLLDDGKYPAGYMYYLCRWVEMGMDAAVPFTEELQWLSTLSSR